MLKFHLRSAIEELQKAQLTYQHFRKDAGWDTQGEK